MRIWMFSAGVMLALFTAGQTLAIDTNATRRLSEAAQAKIKMAEVNVEQLQALTARIARLQEATTNQTERNVCIHDKLLKLNGIVDVSKQAAARLLSLALDDQVDAFETDLATVLAAWDRAEKLANEAENCSDGAPPKPKRTFIVDVASLPLEAHPARTSTNDPTWLLLRRPYVVREEASCFSQKELAQELLRAMDSGWNSALSADDCIAELTRLHVAPLGGWQRDRCVTLDDLCVALGQMLRLPVAAADDPAAYRRALRTEGLPIDTAFPGYSMKGDPPLVLEAEVRAFLADGYSASLPRPH